jgi:copper chaperone CopZ
MVKIFKIEDLECAHCAAKMQEAIQKLDGVHSATVSFLAEKITVDIDEDKANGIGELINKICKKIEPDCNVIY